MNTILASIKRLNSDIEKLKKECRRKDEIVKEYEQKQEAMKKLINDNENTLKTVEKLKF